MKSIKVMKWVGKMPDGSDVEDSTISALSVLLNSKKPEELPRGIDKFRLFGRLSKAFDEAEKTDILNLEEGDYQFLKSIIEKDIPSIWGMNPNIINVIEEFLKVD